MSGSLVAIWLSALRGKCLVRLDEHYVNPRLARIYDSCSGWSSDRDFYLSLAGRDPKKILELGAGTGLISRRLAQLGHKVTAADPSEAMLDFGRGQSGGEEVRWVNATAQNFSEHETYDYIFMTGHAFQVFLTDEDIATALTTVRTHLAKGGLFAFESRNPGFDWTAVWNSVKDLETPEGPVRRNSQMLSYANQILEFDQKYVFEDESIVSKSRLRFASCEDLQGMLRAAGFHVDELYGAWDRSAFTGTSREMVFLARHRNTS
ncbi:MAG: class I SAM-dependent methyltransferase [Roseibium sp.]